MSDAPERIWAFLTDIHNTRGYFSDEREHKTEIEYVRADLARPKVKPLEWGQGGECQIRANSIIGEIVCTKFGGKWFHKGECFGDDIEAAKAAAQADYEQRILSALEGYE